MAVSGDLGLTALADIVQLYAARHETVAIRLESPLGQRYGGALYLEAGELVHATLAEFAGVVAVKAALRMQEGRFTVERGARCERRTIFEPLHRILMEAMHVPEGEDEPGDLAEGEIVVEEEPRSPTGAHTITPRPPLAGQAEALARAADAAAQAAEQAAQASAEAAQEEEADAEVVEEEPAGQEEIPVAPLVHTSPPRGVAPVSSRPPSRSIPPGAVRRPASQPDLAAPRPRSVPPGASFQPSQAVPQAPTSQPAPHAPAQPTTTPLFSGLSPPVSSSGGSRLLLWTAAGAVLLAVAVALVLFLSGRGPWAEPPKAEAVAAAPPAPPPEPPPIVFGMVGPFTGPAKELGRQMRTGVEVAFAAANEAGGIGGRKLKLVALDDGYEPARTLLAMKELVEKHKVAGFVGNVGTPTAVVALPYALEQKLPFFGAFTGAPLLRKDPPDRYVFNYRASYAEETAATVKYLVELRRVKPEQIAVFAQKDSYGDAGFEGVARALRTVYQRDPQRILRVGYERNTIDVQPAVDEIGGARGGVKAVICVATYRAAARFVEKLREKGGEQIVTNVSFVGSSALAEELVQLGPKLAAGVIVTQVVPLPESGSTAVIRYRELLGRFAPGEKPDFVSLEGYVAASILAEGLKKAGKGATTEQMVDALEALRGLDLGLGTTFAFGLSQHQASHKVWGTVLDEKGRFQPLDLD